MSIADPDISEHLSNVIQKELGDEIDLSIVEYPQVGQFLSHAERSPIDLFILLLNNMQFTDTISFNTTSRWPPLEVISHLRETYGRPIIALIGSLGASEEEAKQAGATYFFWVPIDRQSFIDAVEECLRQGSRLEK
jgi:hypothetical protein